MFNESPVFTLDKEGGAAAGQESSSSDLKIIARYPDSDPFLSGFLKGEKVFHKRPALVEAGFGKGRIIIFGFRPQNRAQTQGTFMFLFNSLYYGPAVASSN